MKDEHDMNTAQESVPGIRSREVSEDVLRRRKYHIAITKWEAKWLYWLQAAGALVGFVIVLLPAMSNRWLSTIEEYDFLRFIYEQFSSLGNLVSMILALFAATNAILSLMWKHSYPGWDARKEGGMPNAQQILERQLFPETRKQELVFFVSVVQGLLIPLIVVMMFGVLAFFIRFV